MEKPIRAQENFTSKFYIRMTVQDSPGVLATITKILGDHGVSIASVMQYKGNHQDAELIIITHSVKEGQFLLAEEDFKKTPIVHGIDNIIRVEEN